MRRFAALALLAPLLLSGCGPLPGAMSPEQSPSSGTGVGSGTGTAGPEPAASADPELDAFLAAISGHVPTDPDALVASVEAAGFPRGTIERTREVDSLGAPVTFLEIAVLTDEGCIIGQVGDGEPIAVRTTPLGGGRCLVGEIVTVD